MPLALLPWWPPGLFSSYFLCLRKKTSSERSTNFFTYSVFIQRLKDTPAWSISLYWSYSNLAGGTNDIGITVIIYVIRTLALQSLLCTILWWWIQDSWYNTDNSNSSKTAMRTWFCVVKSKFLKSSFLLMLFHSGVFYFFPVTTVQKILTIFEAGM